MGSTVKTLCPVTNNSVATDDIIDTAGKQLEHDLMELVNEIQDTRTFLPSSFIDNELEETKTSSPNLQEESCTTLNIYGRPIAAIFPTAREIYRQSGDLLGPIPTYAPIFRRPLVLMKTNLWWNPTAELAQRADILKSLNRFCKCPRYSPRMS